MTRLENQKILPEREDEPPEFLKNFVVPNEVLDVITETQQNESFKDVIRLIVILPDDAVTLLTVSLPDESFKIKDVLTQTGLNIEDNMTIDLLEASIPEINYIVSIKIPEDVGKTNILKFLKQEPEQDSDDSEKDKDGIDGEIKEAPAVVKKFYRREPSLEAMTNAKENELQVDSQCVHAVAICIDIASFGLYTSKLEQSVIVTNSEVIIKIPSMDENEPPKTVKIDHKHLVKVFIGFGEPTGIIYYVTTAMAARIKNMLGTKNNLHFDTCNPKKTERRIVLAAEFPFNVEVKHILEKIYSKNNLLEIINCNDLKKLMGRIYQRFRRPFYREDRVLVKFPPGKGGVQLTVADYKRLNPNEWLNDRIIEFYLKYIFSKLPAQFQRKVKVLSPFFWERFSDRSKSGKLLDNEFLIIPINRKAHWIVAIICFPLLKKPEFWDGKLYLTDEDKKEMDNLTNPQNLQYTKRTSIVIFDSKRDTSIQDVFDRLLSLLATELQEEFRADDVLTLYPKVPQQPNSSDCGIFLLTYVEKFLKEPIKDYVEPLDGLENWFTEAEMQKKRKEIAEIISKLFENDEDLKMLPSLKLIKEDESTTPTETAGPSNWPT